jgi:light-regulated signal transduction histidine kinase (bacteriophytochrome)
MFVFRIQDRGIGIEPQFLEQVFDLFARLHTWDQREGTGVGLTLCREVASRHGARIWAEAHAGPGVSLVLQWPDTSTSL